MGDARKALLEELEAEAMAQESARQAGRHDCGEGPFWQEPSWHSAHVHPVNWLPLHLKAGRQLQ
eukprot:8957777-Karenia_brevis.AAC.1